PTVSMLPDGLFASGVTIVGGVSVTDADEMLDVISEGGSGYHLFGKSVRRIVARRG
ncbi:MAG TPA: Fis family transcriptional regulator, partial [Clostridiaceae bacterium]|nr:Fis family transcriptional regulator [Clostridiaceae bacterium]